MTFWQVVLAVMLANFLYDAIASAIVGILDGVG